jgi:type I restriction enzyme S subunit
MIQNLDPHDGYKPSGIPWVGDVPSHWDVVPNRALLRLAKQPVGDGSENHVLLSLTKRGIIRRDIENPEGKFPSSFDTYQVIEPGDLVFCLFDIDETPRAVGLAGLPGMITGAYTRFKCTEGDAADFVYRFYLAMDDGKLLKPLYTGLRKVITTDAFLAAKMPLPPPDERALIIRYLDHIDLRIQRFIAAKERLIELLEEKKQAIFHRAVTRGLDSNVALKPSGVEWLGDVPRHWKVVRAKQVFREIDERSVSGGETHLSMSQRLGLVPRSQLGEGGLISESYAGGKVCEQGDLVLNRLKAHLGVFAVADQPGVVSPDYTVFRARHGVAMPFYEGLLRSNGVRRELVTRVKGVVEGLWRLYTDDFFAISLPMPPLGEQEQIADWLAGQQRRHEAIVGTTYRHVALVREYRRRLISDVVTGKLDVREASRGLADVPALEERLANVVA